MRKILSCLLMLCLLACSAMAEDDELSMEDILAGTDAGGTIVLPETIPDATPEPASIYEPDGSVMITLSALGDFAIGGELFQAELDKQGGDPSFVMKNIKTLLATDDITLMSYEGSLAGDASPAYASLLQASSVEAVSLANEHMLALDAEAFQTTRAALNQAGVAASTSGEPAVYEVKELQVALLSYSCLEGIESLLTRMPQDVAAAKAQYPIVAVYFHWGTENSYTPTEEQVQLGHMAADAGADLVLGSHSRRIQPIEQYNGVTICYSLGNFCYAGEEKPSDMSAYILQARFRVKDGVTVQDGFRIVPIRISSRTDKNDFIPSPMDKAAGVDSILTTLKENGKQLPWAAAEYPLDW